MIIHNNCGTVVHMRDEPGNFECRTCHKKLKISSPECSVLEEEIGEELVCFTWNDKGEYDGRRYGHEFRALSQVQEGQNQ